MKARVHRDDKGRPSLILPADGMAPRLFLEYIAFLQLKATYLGCDMIYKRATEGTEDLFEVRFSHKFDHPAKDGIYLQFANYINDAL